jgi:NAD-dependent DNA ligase
MKNHERGSALIWWVIVLVILTVAASVLAFTQFQESEKRGEEITRLQGEIKNKWDPEKVKMATDIQHLFQATGWSGDAGTTAETVIKLAGDRVTAMKQKFPTHITGSESTLEAALKGVEAAYDETANRLKDTQAALEVAQADAEKAKDATRKVGTDKDQEIAKLNTSIKEEQDRGARNQQTSTQTIEGLRNRITELEGEKQKVETDRKKERNDLENKVLAAQAKIEQINDRNKMIREHDVPDGKVIDASKTSGLAWIDVGARHGLVRGTRFQVFDLGRGGEKRPKGWIEVRELRDGTALCGITDVRDPMDPIVAGDLISNPYFDRDKKPVFVFLGDLPGRYSKDEVTRMLRAKGAMVEDQVTAMTDFLVVGQAPKSDTPVVLEDSPAFQLAKEYGVQVMSANDLTSYIQY